MNLLGYVLRKRVARDGSRPDVGKSQKWWGGQFFDRLYHRVANANIYVKCLELPAVKYCLHLEAHPASQGQALQQVGVALEKLSKKGLP